MSGEPTGFLYPFIEAEELDAGRLVADLARSARAKMAASVALRADTLEHCADGLHRAGDALADRFRRGGRLLAFGNGGSATDADGAVELFRAPDCGRPLPALSLVADQAVLTALANDVGVELMFSRQIIAHGRPDDIALGLSTSGDSGNVLRAFEEADRRGLLTIGMCGYEGGAMAALETLAHCFVVRSDSVHRIQEGQDALMYALWAGAQQALDRVGHP